MAMRDDTDANYGMGMESDINDFEMGIEEGIAGIRTEIHGVSVEDGLEEEAMLQSDVSEDGENDSGYSETEDSGSENTESESESDLSEEEFPPIASYFTTFDTEDLCDNDGNTLSFVADV
jgi:hypothetical protein